VKDDEYVRYLETLKEVNVLLLSATPQIHLMVTHIINKNGGAKVQDGAQ
jgi:hypothetical protein